MQINREKEGNYLRPGESRHNPQINNQMRLKDKSQTANAGKMGRATS